MNTSSYRRTYLSTGTTLYFISAFMMMILKKYVYSIIPIAHILPSYL